MSALLQHAPLSPPPPSPRPRTRLALAPLGWLLVLAVLVAAGASAARDGRALADPAGVAPDGVASTQGLQAPLRRAVERAIIAAAADGVELRVTSGWRSAERQQVLYDEAVAKYGSPERARQWVLPPDESEHVRGAAVDVGPKEGARWLDEQGVRFGLCRRYDNEPWHFERLAAAVGSRCPPREPHA